MKIFDLYIDVISKEVDKNNIPQDFIQRSIQAIIENYSKDGLETPDAIDFNSRDNIYAYIYLYATCHVYAIIYCIYDFRDSCNVMFNNWIAKLTSDFKVCAIGGGPGCDIIAILCFLENFYILPSRVNVSCTVVDRYKKWQSVFYESLRAFRDCGMITDSCTQHFMESDLFEDFSDSLKETIANSDLITMSKFVSAISADQRCKDVLKKIVRGMKPDALLLFTDNSGGKAYGTMEETANECNMELMFGPKCYDFRIDYKAEPKMFDTLFMSAFGARSKINAKIVTAVWQKKEEKLSDASTIPF